LGNNGCCPVWLVNFFEIFHDYQLLGKKSRFVTCGLELRFYL
jgi:hypothetical protein